MAVEIRRTLLNIQDTFIEGGKVLVLEGDRHDRRHRPDSAASRR